MYVREEEATTPKRGRPPKKEEGGTMSKARERIPMGSRNLRFDRKPIPGFRLHWFREDRVDQALRAGYQFVHRDQTINPWSPEEKDGRPEAHTLDVVERGRRADGSVDRTYLMALPQQFYEEDKAMKAREYEETLRAEATRTEDGQYTPTGGANTLGGKPVDF